MPDATSAPARAEGPLAGLRVIELASIGPAPHAALVLADLGAEVVRIERPVGQALDLAGTEQPDMGMRGRRSVELDLKKPGDRESLLQLVSHADVLIEGYRPGVMERLRLGPDECLARNPALIYARVTGWGREGSLAQAVGHDINYLGLTGALHAMGRADQPPEPPLNLVGDYGGGSMLLLLGILSALFERTRSRRGQVVDAAMVDGVALLNQMLLALRGIGRWSDSRGSNLLDGAAPFYATYACADGRYVAVGALEPQFFAELLHGLGLGADSFDQHDRGRWPAMRAAFSERFVTRSRDDWAEHFAEIDACVTPVLTYAEAFEHPHLQGRGTFVQLGGVFQAAPAPKFSRTPAGTPSLPPVRGADSLVGILMAWSQGRENSRSDSVERLGRGQPDAGRHRIV